MTIKPEVLAAIASRDNGFLNDTQWQTIRDELLAMDARLVQADALLRQATEWNWLDEPVEEMNALAQKIEAHLSETRHD
jgi:hypothetical protein